MAKSKFDIRRTVEVEDFGKVTAKASALNSISIALMEAAQLDRKRGLEASANIRDRQSNQIYNALKATGFYKNLN